MAEDTIPRTKRDGTLTISDNAAANSLVISIQPGDLSVTINGETITNVLDRGAMGAPPYLRYADDQPMTFSFSAVLRELSDAAEATLSQFLHMGGFVGSDWVTTMGATGEVDVFTLVWAVEGTDHGSADHTFTLPYCRFTGSISEGDPSSISISGTSYSNRPTSIS